jgi:hypothetical protein
MNLTQKHWSAIVVTNTRSITHDFSNLELSGQGNKNLGLGILTPVVMPLQVLGQGGKLGAPQDHVD